MLRSWFLPLIPLLIGLAACNPGPQEATIGPSAVEKTETAPPLTTVTQGVVPTGDSTSIPTLEPPAAKTAIRRLLTEDVACPSPCFWGITPNQTTLEGARKVYEHLNMPFVLTKEEGDSQYYESGQGFDDGMGVGVIHIVQDGYVRNLRVGIGNSKRHSMLNEWPAFAPKSVLKRYGMPSAVDFYLSYPAEPGEPANLAWYHMIMYFADSNFIIDYNSGYTTSGDLVRACPLIDSFEGLGIWIGENPQYPPLRGIPLEKATKLTMQQFYDRMLQDPGSACFDLIPEAFYK